MAKKRVRKTKQVEEVEQVMTPQILKAIADVDPSFNSGKLLDSIIHFWGGVDKFAYSIVDEYKNCKPGSLVRQRIFEMINRLTMNVSQHAPPSKNAEEMEIEELEEALTTAAGKVAEKLRKQNEQQKAEASKPGGTEGSPAPVGQPGTAPDQQQAKRRGRPRKKAAAEDAPS